ncbi:MAG: LLM class flavin-dependent oxidoreductase [Minicystis sp.]
MNGYQQSPEIAIFSTCPQSTDVERSAYLDRVATVSRWSEEHGYEGILVYTDNRLVDPWLVSQVILQSTARLCPLVAVQPAYMHPYSVAKMVASLGHFYGRRLWLNMVAGGFQQDLEALHASVPHDERYERLIEYTAIIQRLLAGAGSVTYSGQFYGVTNLKLKPALPEKLFPGVLVSGSSAAGLVAARALNATAIMYPKPPGEDPGAAQAGGPSGIRIGIITRETEEEAWRVAHERFPEDRTGQLTHQLAMKVSDSAWHKQLSDLGAQTTPGKDPYWLVPFQNYKTFCPYLVGSYRTTARELARYITLGYRTFILDIPPDEEDLRHTDIAFRVAKQAVRS